MERLVCQMRLSREHVHWRGMQHSGMLPHWLLILLLLLLLMVVVVVVVKKGRKRLLLLLLRLLYLMV